MPVPKRETDDILGELQMETQANDLVLPKPCGQWVFVPAEGVAPGVIFSFCSRLTSRGLE